MRASLAASTGVESAEEVVKYLLAGADVVMTTSALLRHGVGHIATLLRGVRAWLAARDIESLDQVRGLLSHRKARTTGAFVRASYIEVLQGYDTSRREDSILHRHGRDKPAHDELDCPCEPTESHSIGDLVLRIVYTERIPGMTTTPCACAI